MYYPLKQIIKRSIFILLFLGKFAYSQEADPTPITPEYIKKLIQDEVKKALNNQSNPVITTADETITFSSSKIDSTIISADYIKQLVQLEVQKELNKEKASLKADITEEVKAENKKLIGDRIKFSGTALLRLGELDFNQNDINPKTGEVKDLNNRFWTRMNFYLNIDSKLTNTLDVHARLRTGHKQYSFVTFGENVDERFNIILDQLWLNWKYDKYELRVGRQDAGRIWSNQKGVLFDIPMHDGISAVADYKIGNVSITPKLAYFVEMYRNNTTIKDQGKIYGGSIKVAQSNPNTTWRIETGLIKADHLPTRYANDLAQSGTTIKYHDGDLAPNYSIWTNQAAISFKNLHNLTFTADYYNNLKNYKSNPISHTIHDLNGNDSFNDGNAYDNSTAPNFTKQKQGFVGTISVGNLGVPKNLFASVAYLYMEKYAAMDYFAQYDFARWASTNIKGPEFSAGYRFNKNLQMRARYFITQEIKGLDATNPSYRRSADRFRFDLNINF
jgi:hypothetical protein